MQKIDIMETKDALAFIKCKRLTKDALLLFNVDPRNVACGHRTDALALLIFLCLTRQKIDAEHEQRLYHKF